MKVNCESAQDKILEAMDSDALDASAREHLDGCAECRSFQEDFLRIREGMAKLEAADGPSEMTSARILNAAKRQQALFKNKAQKSFWHFALSRPVQVAAMFALIVGVGIYSQKWLERERPDAGFAPATTTPAAPVEEKMPPPAAPPAGPSPVLLEKQAPSPPKAKARESARPQRAMQPEAVPIAAPKQAPAEAPEPLLDAAPPVAPATKDGDKEKIAAPLGGGKAGTEADLAKPPAPAKALQAPAANQAVPEGRLYEINAQDAKGADEVRKKDISSEQEQKRGESASRYQVLLQTAKAKIGQEKWNGALDDLIAAQQLSDSKEVRDLIVMVRSHLRGDE